MEQMITVWRPKADKHEVYEQLDIPIPQVQIGDIVYHATKMFYGRVLEKVPPEFLLEPVDNFLVFPEISSN